MVGATNLGGGIDVWSRDAVTGALTPTAASPYTTLPSSTDRQCTIFTADNRFMYAGSDYLITTNDLATYAFDATTGTLSATGPAIPRPGYTTSMVIVQTTY